MNKPNEQDYFSQGLPNLGNTCYLSCIIQFLYPSAKLRQLMSYNLNKIQKLTFKKAITKIFHQITTNGKLKQKCIKTLINMIKKIDKKIDCHKQQDFFQILMLILNQLFEEDKELQKLFQMETNNQCQCGNYTTTTIFFAGQEQVCNNCQKKIRVTILKQSQLLIVTNQNRQNNAYPQEKLSKEYKNGHLLYECIAKIFYQGDSEVGHYRASRLCANHQFIEFSDLRGQKQYGTNPLYLLYQKVGLELNKERKASSPVVPSSITEKSQIVPNIIHCSKVKLITKISKNSTPKSQRMIYFQFKQIFFKNTVYYQMNVINKHMFILQTPRVITIKGYQCSISEFLVEFEKSMNERIFEFYKLKDKHQKSNFSREFYLNSLEENDQFKDMPFTEVIRNQ